MNLLEKVKTGKLEGEYWVKLKKPSGEYIERITFSKGLTHIVTDPYIEILEILAPCNYEELQRLKEDRNCYKNAYEKTDKEITELIALLKECKEILEILKYESIDDLIASRLHARNLLIKINSKVKVRNKMTDLTKQWKAGGFGLGDYFYVKTKMGDIFIDCIDYDRPHWDGFKNDVEEVLAPVPTYQECLESEAHCVVYSDENKRLNLKISGLQAQNAELIKTNDILSCQNKQLRQLLKECKANFIHRKQLLEKLEGLEKPTTGILTRINAAIGESEE